MFGNAMMLLKPFMELWSPSTTRTLMMDVFLKEKKNILSFLNPFDAALCSPVEKLFWEPSINHHS
jgi:hypothetical protein